MNSLTKGIVGGLAGLMLMSSFMGCSSLNLAQSMNFDLNKSFPWEADNEEIQIPTRMAVVWHETVLNQRRRRGVRGFGARVMFYNEKSDRPIKVEGDVAVYAFDNTSSLEADPTPDRKFVFKHEKLESHYSESTLGHSYSFWVPWGEVGGEPRKIDLMISFEDVTGAKITSDSTRQKLSGISKGMLTQSDKSAEHEASKTEVSVGVIQQTAFTDSTPGTSDYKQRMQTETIEVPKKFAENHLTGSDWAPPGEEDEADNLRQEPPPFEEETPDSAEVKELKPEDSGMEKQQSHSGLQGHHQTVREKFLESEETLQARYAQHRLQAQTEGFAKPVRVPGQLQPNRPGEQSAPSLLEQSIRLRAQQEMLATAPSGFQPVAQ